MSDEYILVLWDLSQHLKSTPEFDEFVKLSIPILKEAAPGDGIPQSTEPDAETDEFRAFRERILGTDITAPPSVSFNRLVVWEVDVEGKIILPDDLPMQARWILEFDEDKKDKYVDLLREEDGRTRRFRAFFSVNGAGHHSVIFRKNVTPTNINYPPLPEPIDPEYANRQWHSMKRRRYGVWLLLVIGLGLAGLAAWMAYSSGSQIRYARDLMRNIAHTETMQESLAGQCGVVDLKKLKAEGADSFPCGGQTIKLNTIFEISKQCAETGINGNQTGRMCSLVWRAAANEAKGTRAAILKWPLLNDVSTPFTQFGPVGVFWPYVLVLAAISAWFVALGLRSRGRFFGAVISPQNRFSLARAQVSMWTIIVLAGFAIAAFFNAGVSMDSFHEQTAKGQDFLLIPTIPAALLLALGISIASPMLSAIILGGKKQQEATQLQLAKTNGATSQQAGDQIVRFLDRPTTGLDVNRSPKQASLYDFFRGEENATRNRLELPRVQNALITLVLGALYAAMLFDFLSGIQPSLIFEALNDGKPLLPTLPDPGASFTSLLALSHGTYLVAKTASG